MTSVSDHLRLLDPVDRDAPPPDGEALMRSIVETPVRRRGRVRRARRPPAFALVVGGLASAGAVALVLAMPGGSRDDVVALAYGALDQPSKILHFRELYWSGSPRHAEFAIEAWQATDSPRQRVISYDTCAGKHPWGCYGHMPWKVAPTVSPGVSAKSPGDLSWFETAIDGNRVRSFRALTNEIVKLDYVEYTEPNYLPGLGDGVRDPRTFMRRALDHEADVVRLPPATIRGIPVVRFEVGRCQWKAVRMSLPKRVHGHVRMVVQRTIRILNAPTVFAVSRRTYLPVRILGPACGPRGAELRRQRGGIDFPVFEVLPATPANDRLLELSPHPGARVVQGH